jgi:hypothetical protein
VEFRGGIIGSLNTKRCNSVISPNEIAPMFTPIKEKLYLLLIAVIRFALITRL